MGHVKFALCRIQQHIMKAYRETKVQVHTFFPGYQMDVSGKFPTLLLHTRVSPGASLC